MNEGQNLPSTAALAREESSWSDAELLATVKAYKELMDGLRQNKASTYRELSERFDRKPGAYERRMQNISAVLEDSRRELLRGLKPQKNIGANVRPRLARFIDEVFGNSSAPPGYEPEVVALLRQPVLPVPDGQEKPMATKRQVTEYVRDVAVKAWTLRNAKGQCECCGLPAPFQTSDDMPFLEVHHIVTLAEGGADTVENAVALCPNCHRRLHYGRDAADLRVGLYRRYARLKPPSA
jgi:5-methylcytosine-specific restriction protein A